jgi:hypothetical protein
MTNAPDELGLLIVAGIAVALWLIYYFTAGDGRRR